MCFYSISEILKLRTGGIFIYIELTIYIDVFLDNTYLGKLKRPHDVDLFERITGFSCSCSAETLMSERLRTGVNSDGELELSDCFNYMYLIYITDSNILSSEGIDSFSLSFHLNLLEILDQK